jgi:hypothetical protein
MRVSNERLTLAPTDLSGFLDWHHLTSLDLRAARGELPGPASHGPGVETLRSGSKMARSAPVRSVSTRSPIPNKDLGSELPRGNVMLTCATHWPGIDNWYENRQRMRGL